MKGVFHVCKRVAAGKSMIKSLRAFKVKTGLFLIKHSLCFPLHKEGEFTSAHTQTFALLTHKILANRHSNMHTSTLQHIHLSFFYFSRLHKHTYKRTHTHTHRFPQWGVLMPQFGWNVCNPCLDVWVEWGSHCVFSSRLQCWPEGAQLWTLHAGSQHEVCENREQYVCACVCGWLCTEVSVCVRMALLSPFTPGGLWNRNVWEGFCGFPVTYRMIYTE